MATPFIQNYPMEILSWNEYSRVPEMKHLRKTWDGTHAKDFCPITSPVRLSNHRSIALHNTKISPKH